MTETPVAQPTPTREPLVVHGIYNHIGRVMIASDEDNLIAIADTGDVKHTPNETTELLSRPGSDDWIDSMVRARSHLARDLCNERAELQRQNTYLTNLGEAILEKAIEKDWCEEYDEFAEEWGLPQRVSEYDVTVNVRVKARNGDEAEAYVRGEFGLDRYSDDIVDGPDFNVEKAY